MASGITRNGHRIKSVGSYTIKIKAAPSNPATNYSEITRSPFHGITATMPSHHSMDNRDGKISGTELTNLAVWQDSNFDGRSDKSEIRTLKELKVKSLSFSQTTYVEGMLKCTAGITFANNEIRDTYDVYLKAVPANNSKNLRFDR